MGVPIKLFLVLVMYLSLPCISMSECPDFECGRYYYLPKTIQSPFRVIDRQPNSCGFPGFDVRCDERNTTLIQLPNSVILNITKIHYIDQKMEVSDPDNCLPKMLIDFDLSSNNSLFYAKYYQEVALFNCSGNYENMEYNGTLDFDLHKVDCLSGLSYTVYSVNALWAISYLLSSNSCRWAANISVPGDDIDYIYPESSFTLYWDEPRCGQCHSIGRRCDKKGDSLHEFECTSDLYPPNEPSSPAVAISLGLGLALFGAAVARLIGVLRADRQINELNAERTIPTTTRPHLNIRGINQSTLDLYPRVVVGESGRLITPDDNTCPICLTEYQINQVLEILPHCQHRFHATCVDQWLLINGTCPICRLPPS